MVREARAEGLVRNSSVNFNPVARAAFLKQGVAAPDRTPRSSCLRAWGRSYKQAWPRWPSSKATYRSPHNPGMNLRIVDGQTFRYGFREESLDLCNFHRRRRHRLPSISVAASPAPSRCRLHRQRIVSDQTCVSALLGAEGEPG
jgi:hypothetical protein